MNDTLAESIEKSSEVFQGRIPRVDVVVQPIYRELGLSSDGFSPEIFKRPEDLRAGVFLVEVRDDDHDDPSTAVDFSHYVAVNVSSDGPRGWFSTGRIAQALVHTDIERVRCLLSDILLDVAVFHSYARLVDTWGASVSKRREFSRLKVEYARQNGLTSFYGPIADDQIDYFSFAAACRQSCGFETGIDFDRYADLWNDFVTRTLLDAEKEVELPIERRSAWSQFKRHLRFSGQLPEARITKQLMGLEPGTYYLLMPQRRPHRIVERDAVANFFGRSKWRRGSYRILTTEQFRSFVEEKAFKRWYSAAYMSYFKFIIQ